MMRIKRAMALLDEQKSIRRPVWPAGYHLARKGVSGYAMYDAAGVIVWRSLTTADKRAGDWQEYLP